MLKFGIVLMCVILSSCASKDAENQIAMDKLFGIYKPDNVTKGVFKKLGFDDSATIAFDENLNLHIRSMPSIWKDWSGSEPRKYDHADGSIEFLGARQVLMHLVILNGVATSTSYAGAEYFVTSESSEIRIAYKGWDRGDRLVFRKQISSLSQ